jgi:hypothetical protein
MARGRQTSWGPVIRPAVALILLLIFAFVLRGSIWMTAALVLALIAFAFLAIAVLSRIPTRKDPE